MTRLAAILAAQPPRPHVEAPASDAPPGASPLPTRRAKAGPVALPWPLPMEAR